MHEIAETVVLVGHAASCEHARSFALESRGCPYVADYNAIGSLVVGVYVLPASKRWWIEVPAEKPELMGMQKIDLVFAGETDASSAWLRGEVDPVLMVSPCRSDCRSCPYYEVRCNGCPATVFYNG